MKETQRQRSSSTPQEFAPSSFPPCAVSLLAHKEDPNSFPHIYFRVSKKEGPRVLVVDFSSKTMRLMQGGNCIKLKPFSALQGSIQNQKNPLRLILSWQTPDDDFDFQLDTPVESHLLKDTVDEIVASPTSGIDDVAVRSSALFGECKLQSMMGWKSRPFILQRALLVLCKGNMPIAYPSDAIPLAVAQFTKSVDCRLDISTGFGDTHHLLFLSNAERDTWFTCFVQAREEATKKLIQPYVPLTSKHRRSSSPPLIEVPPLPAFTSLHSEFLPPNESENSDGVIPPPPPPPIPLSSHLRTFSSESQGSTFSDDSDVATLSQTLSESQLTADSPISPRPLPKSISIDVIPRTTRDQENEIETPTSSQTSSQPPSLSLHHVGTPPLAPKSGSPVPPPPSPAGNPANPALQRFGAFVKTSKGNLQNFATATDAGFKRFASDVDRMFKPPLARTASGSANPKPESGSGSGKSALPPPPRPSSPPQTSDVRPPSPAPHTDLTGATWVEDTIKIDHSEDGDSQNSQNSAQQQQQRLQNLSMTDISAMSRLPSSSSSTIPKSYSVDIFASSSRGGAGSGSAALALPQQQAAQERRRAMSVTSETPIQRSVSAICGQEKTFNSDGIPIASILLYRVYSVARGDVLRQAKYQQVCEAICWTLNEHRESSVKDPQKLAYWLSVHTHLLHALKSRERKRVRINKEVTATKPYSFFEELSGIARKAFKNLVNCVQRNFEGQLLLAFFQDDPEGVIAQTQMSKVLAALEDFLWLLNSQSVFQTLQIQMFKCLFFFINALLFNAFLAEPSLCEISIALRTQSNIQAIEKWLQMPEISLLSSIKISSLMNHVTDMCNLIILAQPQHQHDKAILREACPSISELQYDIIIKAMSKAASQPKGAARPKSYTHVRWQKADRKAQLDPFQVPDPKLNFKTEPSVAWDDDTLLTPASPKPLSSQCDE